MELKFVLTTEDNCAEVGSNRTFMELKFDSSSVLLRFSNVLIVPLWN